MLFILKTEADIRHFLFFTHAECALKMFTHAECALKNVLRIMRNLQMGAKETTIFFFYLAIKIIFF